MTIYISIPMTGNDMEVQRSIADMWQKYFESQKCEVVNPFLLSEICRTNYLNKYNIEPDYSDYLKFDLVELKNCTHLFLCQGWVNSNGCLEEVREAMKYNIQYIFERTFKIQ